MLFYLAGLQTLPGDVLEAATIDGANGWQRLRHVIVPLLAPTTAFMTGKLRVEGDMGVAMKLQSLFSKLKG